MRVASDSRQIMLPILHDKSTCLLASTASLLISLSASGCGKTPDSMPAHPGSTSHGPEGSPAVSSDGNTPAFDCPSTGTQADMVSVPAAAFPMGCEASVDNQCKADEKPLHTVSLTAFEIDRTEVTQEEYAACIA